GSVVESVDTLGLYMVAYGSGFQNGDLIIGAYGQSASHINADMDEVKFFNHALSGSDVLDTYNNPTTSPAATNNLISSWKGEGNALDSVGSNNGFLYPPATTMLSDPAVLTTGLASLTN